MPRGDRELHQMTFKQAMLVIARLAMRQERRWYSLVRAAEVGDGGEWGPDKGLHEISNAVRRIQLERNAEIRARNEDVDDE